MIYSSVSDPHLSTAMGLTSLLISLMLFFPAPLLFFTSNGSQPSTLPLSHSLSTETFAA